MYAKNFLNSIDEVKAKSNNTTAVLSESTKGTMVGAAVGCGVALFIGFYRKKNLLMSGFIGAVIGGAVSRAFIVKK
jgi:uncharacterized membrane protein YeaQ/YmgE (transglycosylase-associated protein family)